jgi:PEP-CTERM motif-containing protein
MHGLSGNFNAQELANVFEANKSYTFSLWAQNDEVLNETNGVGLYIFDGNVAFNPIGTGYLATNLFTTSIPQRMPGMTAVQSQANWGQISVTHTVVPGAPEIGHPIGVGFRGFKDSAVDDATLVSNNTVTQVLYVEVNTTNGTVRLRNQTGATVNIDYYEITSAQNSLNASWAGFQNANPAISGFPQGNGTGNGWEKAGGSNSGVLSESFLTGNSAVVNNANLSLGTAFNLGGAQQLQFKYGSVLSVNPPQTGDYNNNGVVDAADYVLWRKGGPLANDPSPGVQPSDYNQWRAAFGNASGPTGPGTLITGGVIYVTSASGSAVPEPATVLLVGVGIALLTGVNLRKNRSSN